MQYIYIGSWNHIHELPWCWGKLWYFNVHCIFIQKCFKELMWALWPMGLLFVLKIGMWFVVWYQQGHWPMSASPWLLLALWTLTWSISFLSSPCRGCSMPMPGRTWGRLHWTCCSMERMKKQRWGEMKDCRTSQMQLRFKDCWSRVLKGGGRQNGD